MSSFTHLKGTWRAEDFLTLLTCIIHAYLHTELDKPQAPPGLTLLTLRLSPLMYQIRSGTVKGFTTHFTCMRFLSTMCYHVSLNAWQGHISFPPLLISVRFLTILCRFMLGEAQGWQVALLCSLHLFTWLLFFPDTHQAQCVSRLSFGGRIWR